MNPILNNFNNEEEEEEIIFNIMPFALHPATVNDEPLDYETSEGIKIFKQKTTKLLIKFDLSTDKLLLYSEVLRSRITTAGWGDILSSPREGAPANERTPNLLRINFTRKD